MTDYISRVDAVGVLRNAQFEYTCDEAAEFLLHIPAADVRPVVRGKWIFYDSFAWKCTHCGWLNYHNMGVPNAHNFCPNCGAEMEES